MKLASASTPAEGLEANKESAENIKYALFQMTHKQLDTYSGISVQLW